MKIPNVDIGFIKYLCALNIKIPDNPYSNQVKISDSGIKKMKRYYEKMFGDRWKAVWEENKLSRKALNKIKYERNAFDIKYKIKYNVVGAERRTDLIALILILKAYFERLIVENKRYVGRISIFGAISDSLHTFLMVQASETSIPSWIIKRSLDRDIRIVNWDAFLDGHLQFYAEHRGIIDAVTDQYLEEATKYLDLKKKKKEK